MNGSHQKMMLNRIKKINITIIATRKVIDIENEQIKAMPRLAPVFSMGNGVHPQPGKSAINGWSSSEVVTVSVMHSIPSRSRKAMTLS